MKPLKRSGGVGTRNMKTVMVQRQQSKYNHNTSSSSSSWDIILKLLAFIVGFIVVIALMFTTTTPADVERSHKQLLETLAKRGTAAKQESSPQQQQPNNQSSNQSSKRPLRILYTITTLAEYDSGGRSTSKGSDRMQNVLIPVMKEGVESMLEFGYDVDVYIVSYYEMTRYHLLRQALPSHVNITVWDDAYPITYKGDGYEKDETTGWERPKPKSKLVQNSIGLARQHRFVVKDHLNAYDFFCNFEDDMLIKGEHVSNFIEMTNVLYKLRETAPDDEGPKNGFYGSLSKEQLKRTIPGFIRVETLLDEEHYSSQKQLDPVPVMVDPHPPPLIDPKPCCHLRNVTSSSSQRPMAPTSDKLFLWEVGIKSVGVRHMPGESSSGLGWVVQQRGPTPRKGERDLTIPDYWSNRDNKYFNEKRPPSIAFDQINNQGGWMGTQQQILEWHTEVCPGGFLPPYESPHYRLDGLDQRNVEWWSGGISLVTQRHACNMQRIISLDPIKFSKHLLYHSANNKQRQLAWKNKVFVKVNDFYGQLMTVRHNAQQEMEKQLQQEK